MVYKGHTPFSALRLMGDHHRSRMLLMVNLQPFAGVRPHQRCNRDLPRELGALALGTVSTYNNIYNNTTSHSVTAALSFTIP